MASQAAQEEKEFKEFKERVYQQKRKQILDDLADLENGTHTGYNEQVLHMKKDRDYALRVNARYQVLELQWIEEEYETSVERIQKEGQDKIDLAERKLRQELEAYRSELRSDHKHRGTPQESLMSDLDVSGKKHRTTTDKQRKRLFSNDKGVTHGGKRGRRGKGAANDKYIPLKLNKVKEENLEMWEIEQDIRQMNNIHGVSSRGRRPPAKLAGRAGSK